MQQRVIELGKALVKELDVEPGVDTLTRWMAHYIAGLLMKLEVSVGDEKVECQNRCFEAILTIWQHRTFYRNGHRPFENFQPIFKALESLNSANGGYLYLQGMKHDIKPLSQKSDGILEWINVLHRTDELARILMSYSLQKAIVYALDDKTLEWLGKSMSLIQDDELKIIIKLTEGATTVGDTEVSKKDGSDQAKELESKLEKINEFIKMAELIKLKITEELNILT